MSSTINPNAAAPTLQTPVRKNPDSREPLTPDVGSQKGGSGPVSASESPDITVQLSSAPNASAATLNHSKGNFKVADSNAAQAMVTETRQLMTQQPSVALAAQSKVHPDAVLSLLRGM